MKIRVFFIWSGYEVVHFVTVTAESFGDAFKKAIDQYETEGWNFLYNELEAEVA